MKTVFEIIKNEFCCAISQVAPLLLEVDPMIRLTTEGKFGDYQSNVAMGLAKTLRRAPREVAQEIVQNLQLAQVCERVEIAGPGFINLFLSRDYLAGHLTRLSQEARLGAEQAAEPVHHIIDYSSPNLAKEMHVGHLRSTIIGEVLARVIEFAGHTVDRVNHVGDWGTQFGMLLQYIYEYEPQVLEHPDQFHVTDLEVFYKKAKACFDGDVAFADSARQKVVLLQSHDPSALAVWRAFVTESLRHCHAIYQRLGVTVEDVGESFYNDRLAGVVTEFKTRALAREDQGAVCVFLDGFTNREGEPLPMIIQKSDGGYNYDTTDLAAIKYRVAEKQGRRLIYVTDIRQAQHFEMVFAAARLAGWAGDEVRFEHVGFGMVLGADRKPFKTRDGGTVRLRDLIEESVARARAMFENDRGESHNDRVRAFSEEKKALIAERVGLSAIKYADLSHNLASDYVFNWDKMLAMEGNTGPYMLYAYARIMSIGRKGGVDFNRLSFDGKLLLLQAKEIELAKELCRFGDVVREVALQLRPNLLTDYLYTLSKTFSGFYDKNTGVSVLEAETEELRNSRLCLCGLTAKTLKQGLYLLGIEVVEEM